MASLPQQLSPPSLVLPLLVKLSPDLTREEKESIARLLLALHAEGKIDGLIVSNTTTARPACLVSPEKSETGPAPPPLGLSSTTGGLSGAPLKDISTRLIGEMFLLTEGRVSLPPRSATLTPSRSPSSALEGSLRLRTPSKRLPLGPRWCRCTPCSPTRGLVASAGPLLLLLLCWTHSPAPPLQSEEGLEGDSGEQGLPLSGRGCRLKGEAQASKGSSSGGRRRSYGVGWRRICWLVCRLSLLSRAERLPDEQRLAQ
jgi:hypothetical protein